MLKPNFDILMWILFWSYVVHAIGNILAGATKTERSTHYDISNVIFGLIQIGLIIWIILG